tara:strand:- start:389 stop:853 length:465 start_codon:yes stop_codon:yes gene_type:complete
MIDELRKLFAPHPDTDMSGFKWADLFDNERWRTSTRPSYSPKRGEDISFREYVPRAKKDITEKTTIGDDGQISTVVTSKYIDEGPVYGFRMFDTPSGHRQFRPDDGMGANTSLQTGSFPAINSEFYRRRNERGNINSPGDMFEPSMDLEMRTDL